MNEIKICQSCGISMNSEEQFGTSADGNKTDEYCADCFISGKFAGWCKDMTLDEAVEDNIKYIIQAGVAETEEEARKMLKSEFLKLKRWSGA